MSLVAKIDLLAEAVAVEIDVARAEAAAEVSASALSITSRGGGMWTNGTGLLGDNSNFSLFVWDPAEGPPGTSGAFRADGLDGVVKYCDEFIPINPDLVYRCQAKHKANAASRAANRSSYIGFSCYDADGNLISATAIMRLSEKAVLTRPWTPDTDTYLYIDRDPTGLDLATTLSYRKGFALWDYVGATGLAYEDYTRRRTTSWSTAPTITDIGGGEWQIGPLDPAGTTSAFGGALDLSAAVPAGVKIAQANSGGTYLYTIKSGGVPEADWVAYEGFIGGANTDGNSRSYCFMPGTAKVRPLFLVNYNATVDGESQWFAGFDMRVAPDMKLAPVAGTHGGEYYQSLPKAVTSPGEIGIAWGSAQFTSAVTLVLDYLGDWVTRYHLTVTEALAITLPTPPTGHPARFTLQLKNQSGYAVSFAGTNWVKQPGIDLSEGPQPIIDMVWDQVAARWRAGNTAGKSGAPALVQQDSADTGRTIYVQFDGDAAPASPVRGDVRIREL